MSHQALPPLVRSAGLKIDKPGEAGYPEQVRLDPALWRQLNEPSDKG
jgi:hypothetical protein